MEWIDRYKCNLCGCVWNHKWDTEDYNNDYTSCPECDECDFDEVDSGGNISHT